MKKKKKKKKQKKKERKGRVIKYKNKYTLQLTNQRLRVTTTELTWMAQGLESIGALLIFFPLKAQKLHCSLLLAAVLSELLPDISFQNKLHCFS